jgi:hypothetical protein
MSDRVVRVEGATQVVRSAGQPSVARATQTTTRVVLAGNTPGRDGKDAPQPEPLFDFAALIDATLSI